MKTITVEIVNGEVVIRTTGYTGTSCHAATKALEAALGQTTKDTPCTDTLPAQTLKAGAR